MLPWQVLPGFSCSGMDNMNETLLSNHYVKDILSQPEALQDTITGLETLPLTPFQSLAEKLSNHSLKQVVLTGMGSSYHALHPITLSLLEHGIQTLMLETSELIHYAPRLLSPETLVVAVSQSGRSAEIVQLLEMIQHDVPMIGITNTPESPLAQQANMSLFTRAGSEFSVSCKTYIATLAALSYLGEVLLGYQPAETLAELQTTAGQMSLYLKNWEKHVDYLIRDLKGIQSLMLAGRGSSLAAAGTGGLIIKESAHFHAEGMSSAAFRHGPFEMVSPEMMVLVFAGIGTGKPLNANLVADILKAGGRAELISVNGKDNPYTLPAVPLAQLPLLEILPVQMVSLALALLNQHDPGTFERGSKVTTIA